MKRTQFSDGSEKQKKVSFCILQFCMEKLSLFIGVAELDVQGVQLHTQYLASYGLEIAQKMSQIFPQ